MKLIYNSKLLLSYIKKYNLNSIFEREMIEYMELFSFVKGELICSKNTEMKYIYFLVSGKLKIYTLHDNGKSVLLRFSNPLSILGDVEFLTDVNINCNVEALNQGVLIAMKFDILHKYAYNDSSFLRFVIKNLSSKLYTTSNSASINLLYPLENRFASYLISVSMDNTNGKYNELKTSRLTDIANLLGTSYRHLCRVVNKLISDGIIEKSKGTIIVKNPNRLKDLSGGNLYE